MMRQRLFSLIACLLTALSVCAEKVSEEEAIKKAKTLMPTKTFLTDTDFRARKKLPPKQQSSKPIPLYILNAEDDGFVIVAGDDRVPEILGYSEHGCLDISTAPSNVKWWLESCKNTISMIQEAGEEASLNRIRKTVSNTKEEIVPFITTTWGQETPYNNQCPTFGQKCVTGCVATAMAQVMNYCKWPVGMTAEIPEYSTATNNIFMPSLNATSFDWENMAEEDIARLMLYCGQAVEMDYEVDKSSASDADIAYALKNTFNYDYSVSHVSRNSYTLDEWEGLIYEELRCKRPVIYNGQSNLDGSGGHSFICNGYKDGLYYINWGWEGLYDGFYDLSIIEPIPSTNYQYNQTAIIGIQKQSNINIVEHEDGILYLYDGNTHLQYTLDKNRKEAMLGIIYDFDTNSESARAEYIDVFSSSYPSISYENVIIPQTITTGTDTFTVTSIASRAFYKEVGLKRIDLPESIKNIGAEAFKYCVNLTNINVPNLVTEIQDGTFEYCKKLQHINLPKSVWSIGDYAFSDCLDLRKIVIPRDCSSIGNNAFKWCRQLKTLIIEDSESLLNLGYNDEVGIEYYPFMEDQIDGKPHYRGAFSDSDLDTLYLGRNITYPVKKMAYVSNTWKTCFPFEYCSEYRVNIHNYYYQGPQLNSLVFGGGITNIPDSLFWNGTILNELVFPEGIQSIGTRTFAVKEYGTSLNQERIVLPASLKEIGIEAFGKEPIYTGGKKLRFIESKSIVPPQASPNTFGDCAVYVPAGTGANYRSLWGGLIIDPSDEMISVNVRTPGSLYSRLIARDIQPNNVCKLKVKGLLNDDDWDIITEMSSLYELDMSELPITELPHGIFKEDLSLVTVALPQNLKIINDEEFSQCRHLSSISHIPFSCTSIGSRAFYNTRIDSLIFSGPLNVAAEAFLDCKGIEEIIINSGCIIGEKAFYSSGIKKAVIGSQTKLGSQAFYDSELTKATIADGVYIIGDDALGNKIEEISFEGIVDSIGIVSTEKLSQINVRDIETWCCLPLTNIIEDEYAPHLYIGGIEAENIVIPNTIKKIRDNLFTNCKSLYTIQLPTGIKGLGRSSFEGCNNLESITLPNSLEIINERVFKGCTKLNSIEFPSKLKEICDSAFLQCSSLTTIEIPEKLSILGKLAFGDCINLNRVVTYWNEPLVITSTTFTNIPNDCVLYVPIGKASLYSRAGWTVFPKLKEMGLLSIQHNDGGIIKYGNTTITNHTEKLFFAPYQSFSIGIEAHPGKKSMVILVNNEDAKQQLKDEELLFEEPEENINLIVIFTNDKCEQGDVNDDGIINNEDVSCIMQYILKHNSDEMIKYVGDMNNDRVINITDAIITRDKSLQDK